MIARIVGLLLGLVLAGLGWAIVQPEGLLGSHLPALSLGAFEPERYGVGYAAVLLGVVVFIAGLMPKPPGGGSKKKRKSSGYVTDFGVSEPAAASGTEAMLEPEPAEASAPAAPPGPPPEPAPAPEQRGEFVALRNELHALARKEDWTQAAALARRLPTLAANDGEKLLAAIDLADLSRAQGKPDEAYEAYEEAVSYGRAMLAAGNPKAPGALAGALTGVGDIASEEGRLDAALDAYEEAVALRRKAVAVSSNAQDKRALSLALERLADAREDRGHRVRALALYKESFDIAGALAAADPTAYGADFAITRERLAELEARLA
jgi:tetratricopeptide (TPR) repeat protein